MKREGGLWTLTVRMSGVGPESTESGQPWTLASSWVNSAVLAPAKPGHSPNQGQVMEGWTCELFLKLPVSPGVGSVPLLSCVAFVSVWNKAFGSLLRTAHQRVFPDEGARNYRNAKCGFTFFVPGDHDEDKHRICALSGCSCFALRRKTWELCGIGPTRTELFGALFECVYPCTNCLDPRV